MYRSKLQYLKKKRILIAKCEIHDGAYEINRIYFSVTPSGYQVFSSQIHAHIYMIDHEFILFQSTKFAIFFSLKYIFLYSPSSVVLYGAQIDN